MWNTYIVGLTHTSLAYVICHVLNTELQECRRKIAMVKSTHWEKSRRKKNSRIMSFSGSIYIYGKYEKEKYGKII